jgi:hypothetical protein
MKWYGFLPILALAAVPMTASSQTIKTISIGKIAQVDDPAPTVWGMSGMEMVKLTASVGNRTPIMRSETFDARTVEILTRTQAPPLRQSDIKAVKRNGRDYVTVRNWLLIEVMPEDARAEGKSTTSLANYWASRVRRVLPQVGPTPNRFGA